MQGRPPDFLILSPLPRSIGRYLTSRLFGAVGIAAPVKAEAAMTLKT